MASPKSLLISICITTFNEEETITELLDSLFFQTVRPFEIFICDGGSTDRTVRIIKKLQKKHPSLKLCTSRGSVAHGRNVALKKARGWIIVSVDSGCFAKEDWLEKITNPLKDKTVDIVAGFYEMKWRNSFQKIMALYRGTPPERYDPDTFIPSCRSVAFRKSVWRDVGGFNENLSLSGEDTQFFYKALAMGKKMVRVKDAIVYWNEPMQFGWKDFKKFFYYARGDAQTGIWWDPIKKWRTHNIKLMTIYIRYILLTFLLTLSIFHLSFAIFAVFCLLFFVYCFWSIWKWRDVVTDWRERMWIPVIQIGTDVMVMSGFLVGLIHHRKLLKNTV